jgi:catechol-2,3-dioxygenase
VDSLAAHQETATAADIVQPRYFAHIAIRVLNYDASRDWYAKAIGGWYIYCGPLASMCSFDDEHHRVALFNFSVFANRQSNAAAFERVAYRYTNEEELAGVYRFMRDEGHEPARCVRYGQNTSLIYRDPDGIPVEFMVDAGMSPSDMGLAYSGGMLLEDKNGDDFEPKDLFAQYSEKVPFAQPAAMGTVTLKTTRFEEMIDWYKAVVGYSETYRDETICLLGSHYNAQDLRIQYKPDCEPLSQEAGGMDHIAYSYETYEDFILHTYDRLRGIGILPHWTPNHGGTFSLYYLDPDGNQVELTVDNFPSLDAAKKWMDNEEFRKDPIGADFDPEVMVARVRAGATQDDLRPWGSCANPNDKIL